MKRCEHCACMVKELSRCHGCGAFVEGSGHTSGAETGFEDNKNAQQQTSEPLPPTNTDEGFDLLGQVGRVRRRTR